MWGQDRNLIAGSTPEKQFSKTMEEVGELGIAIGRHDVNDIIDSIGDVLVTLILVAEHYGLTLEECLESAYNEIKDRKGKLVNGVFVKEAS